MLPGLSQVVLHLHAEPKVGLVPSALDSLTAISALIPARPLRIADSARRETASFCAAAVTLVPSGR